VVLLGRPESLLQAEQRLLKRDRAKPSGAPATGQNV
jgi:hypothetical protein